MKKRTMAAAIAVLCLFTACGKQKLPEVATGTEVYENTELAEDPAKKDSPKTEAKKPADASPAGSGEQDAAQPAPSAGKDYMHKIMFVGDDMLVPFASSSRTDNSAVFAKEGISADEMLGTSFSGSTPAKWAEENKPEYIYIWLGVNDLRYCNDYSYYMSMNNVVNTLHEASPESVIVIMQLPPVTHDSSWDSEHLGGDAHYDIGVYNDTLRQLISDSHIKELYFLEINDAVCDEGTTWLSSEYDGGDGLHLNDSAYSRLADHITEKRFHNENFPDDGSSAPAVTSAPDPEEDTDGEEADGSVDEGLADESGDTETAAPLVEVSGDYREMYPEMYASRADYTQASPKVCYLTFDDGPSDNTPDILDILDRNGIKASFFIVGKSVDGREDILRRERDDGHTIGIHTYSHDYEEIYSSADAYVADFNKAYNVLGDTAGIKPWMFRFPGGSYNNFNTDTAEEIINEMNRRGFTYFDWNCATSDAALGSDYDSCMENFKDTLSGDYEIVLMHDSKETTVNYLQDLIDYAKEQGYVFDVLDNANPIHF